jgi:hypothetical protein
MALLVSFRLQSCLRSRLKIWRQPAPSLLYLSTLLASYRKMPCTRLNCHALGKAYSRQFSLQIIDQ